MGGPDRTVPRSICEVRPGGGSLSIFGGFFETSALSSPLYLQLYTVGPLPTEIDDTEFDGVAADGEIIYTATVLDDLAVGDYDVGIGAQVTDPTGGNSITFTPATARASTLTRPRSRSPHRLRSSDRREARLGLFRRRNKRAS